MSSVVSVVFVIIVAACAKLLAKAFMGREGWEAREEIGYENRFVSIPIGLGLILEVYFLPLAFQGTTAAVVIAAVGLAVVIGDGILLRRMGNRAVAELREMDRKRRERIEQEKNAPGDSAK